MEDWCRIQTQAMYVNACCVAVFIGALVGLAMYILSHLWQVGMGAGVLMFVACFAVGLWGPHD